MKNKVNPDDYSYELDQYGAENKEEYRLDGVKNT